MENIHNDIFLIKSKQNIIVPIPTEPTKTYLSRIPKNTAIHV